MKKFFLRVLVLSVSLVAFALLAPFSADAAGTTKSKVAPSTTYLVVKITNENKDEKKGEKKIEYKVIPSTQLKDEKKRLNEDYKKKLDEYQDRIKTDHTAQHPIKPTIKQVGDPYKTQTVAQETAKKLQDEAEGKDDPKVKEKDTRK
jgi:hypothetical protein